MNHEERKVAKIVEELTIYFFSVGASQIYSSIEREEGNATITVKANYDIRYREELENLDIYLNGPKNDGMEDVYWELAGSGNLGETSELLLVGMMVDEAEIRIGEDFVEVRMEREAFR